MRRTQADLDAMANALEGMKKHSLATQPGRIADRNFHSVLLRSTDNVFLVSLTSGIGAAVSWTTIFKQRHKPLSRDPVPDHERVYEAVKAKDAAAAREAMAALVDLALLDTTQARRSKIN